MIKHPTLYGYLGDDFAEPNEGTGVWTKSEHARFLKAVELYPEGPWKRIADLVQTRSIRQVQTHAQKYREKILRRQWGLMLKVAVPKAVSPADHPYNPLPLGSTKALLPFPVVCTASSDEDMPALPECLDFFIELLTQDLMKVEPDITL